MQSKLKQKIIFDANVIIELHKFSLWKPVTHACNAAVTSIIKREVRYYKDLEGYKKPIELSKDIESQKGSAKQVVLSKNSC